MARVSNIRPFIQKWEGGLSRNPADSASAHPAPWPYKGVTGWHTNKGVTYSTFSSLANKLGYANSPENFFLMPDDIWDKIFSYGYWDQWYLTNLNSQAIADLIADFAWGSGVNGSFHSIQKYLAAKGKPVTTTSQAVDAINQLIQFSEEEIFLQLVSWRETYFRSLGQPVFLSGWLRRLYALRDLGVTEIKKKSS